MKQLNLLLMAWALGSVSAAAAPGQLARLDDGPVTLYGYVSSSKAWTEDRYNIYKFDATENPTFTCVPDEMTEPVAADGGGCYHDGKYYAVQYASFMGMVLADFCTYNAETWQMESYIPVAQGSVGVDMDYDVTTGMIYGCFYSDEWDHCVFGHIDPETGYRTAIRDLDRIYFGMAVNSRGEVYGISEEGNLVRFDKQTGVPTLIGNTGVTPEYLAGATFDLRTDELYWTVSSLSNTKTGLYRVDTQTAEATCITHFENNEEVQGLYIPIPAAEPLAPAIATELELEVEGPSLSGLARFRAPLTTFDESNDLRGMLAYHIYADGMEVNSGECEPGAITSATFSVPNQGAHVVTVRTANAVGLSPATQANAWFGYDSPTAVTELTATEGAENGQVVVRWTAPASTQHNGYLDTEALTYRIVRMPDLKAMTTAETTLTDQVPTDMELTAYTYEVTPVVRDTLAGPAATSNTVAVGQALHLPYYQDFAEASSFDLYTIVDRHNDGKTWAHDATFEAARAEYDWVNPKNDWLITPALQMDTEHVQKLQFDAWCRDGNNENLEVKMGKGKSYTQMTHDILPRQTELTGMEPRHFMQLLVVDEAGDWNIGFHAVSPVDRWWLYVDNIRVEQGPLLGTPHQVTSLTATEGQQGALQATLCFTTPTTMVEGGALDGLTRIDIYRNGILTHSIETPAMGEPLTYLDEAAKQGINTYRIVPVNAKGEGLEAEVDVYVGEDIPLAPTNVLLQKVDELPVLTWTAPTTGVNGKYVNPDKVVYYIVRSDNKQVGTQVTGTTFTDETLPLIGDEQAFYLYAIYAQNVAGLDEEQVTVSNEVCFGRPFDPTFHESFAEVSLEQGPWTWDIVQGDPYIQIVSAGEYPVCEAQDDDHGLVSFKPEEIDEEAILKSANIELREAETPRLTFWYWMNPGSFDKIKVSVRVDDNPANEPEVIYINMSSENVAEGWTEAEADLKAYCGHRIQLLFDFVAASGEYIHIDNITVSDRFDHRLPAVNDLVGEATEQGVLLTWSEPATGTFAQPLGLVGFNIYRNGELLNTDEPEVETVHLDTQAKGAPSYTYRVSTVYDLGESYLSNAVTIASDGIRTIHDDAIDQPCYNLMGQRILSKEAKRGRIIIKNMKKCVE